MFFRWWYRGDIAAVFRAEWAVTGKGYGDWNRARGSVAQGLEECMRVRSRIEGH